MPTTRSASRAAAASAPQEPETARAPSKSRSAAKRKASDADTPPTKVPRKKTTEPTPKTTPTSAVPFEIPPSGTNTELLPAKLTFSFEDAKKHLVAADARFMDVFNRLPCKPYEKLERIEPFSTLTSSILGQQISWLAARSVRHKFIRLYFPELPEKPDDAYWAQNSEDRDKFPTPYQVSQTSIPVLRSAGLSARKAEYVQDLAARFADGRLTSKKVLEAEDEELYEMLTAVRGIGRWTVDMFAIFSLRRPDIMPSGDLGVQRGVLRWFLSLHNPDYRIDLSPKKVSQAQAEQEAQTQDESQVTDTDTLPVFGEAGSSEAPGTPPRRTATLPAIDVDANNTSSSKTRPGVAPTPSMLGLPSLPPAFTPSFDQILNHTAEEAGTLPMPLPAGLTVAEIKARLSGKKKVKGALATPAEMEALTETWRPYRSLGVYYMWALAEEKGAK
ncbi:DNA glycosylase [Vararia minispora EC-137]|uniref:DNA glycosylase n=1 Tax=Vararia minispora EC-137 TaxID=1314806 RepID=A0ACB8QLM3_9AGAM|nr:DNA glycosylase [Vararia minispora EC-137]